MIAVYPGTFDPITNGHIDLVRRVAGMFDRTILAVAEDSGKTRHFSTEARVAMAKKAVADIPTVAVHSFSGLLVNAVQAWQGQIIVRGLRAISDFEYEVQLANLNRQLSPKLETVFVAASQQYMFISSSMVREIAFLGGDVSGFVPPCVQEALAQKLPPV